MVVLYLKFVLVNCTCELAIFELLIFRIVFKELLKNSEIIDKNYEIVFKN